MHCVVCILCIYIGNAIRREFSLNAINCEVYDRTTVGSIIMSRKSPELTGPEKAAPGRRTTTMKIKEELVCAICLDLLNKPKLLVCAHSFCQSCIGELVIPAGEEGSTIRCPSCREVTALANGDVSQLRTNFRLESMVGIVSDEDKVNIRFALKYRKKTIDDWQLPLCSTHLKAEEYYCADCNELLCRRCMMDRHRFHRYEEAEVVVAARLRSLRSLVQPALEAAAKAEDLEGQVGKRNDSIATSSASVQAGITAFFDRARSLLNQREELLRSQVQSYADEKIAKLKKLKETLSDNKGAILDTVDEIETYAERSGDVSILTETQSIAETLNVHQRSILGISESLSFQGISSSKFLTFDENQDSEVLINRLGMLSDRMPSPVPSNSSRSSSRNNLKPDDVTGQPSISSTAPKRTPPIVNVGRSQTVRPSLPSLTTVLPRLKRDVSLPLFPTCTSSDTIYEPLLEEVLRLPVAVIPIRRGRADIRSEVHPFGVAAVSKSDSIIVSDVHNHSVKVFATTGRIIDMIGSDGKDRGQFRAPAAITTDIDGNIYVLDRENHRIQKFSNGLFEEFKFEQKAQKNRVVGDPWGITISDDGKIFVSDWQNDCIHSFDRSGKYQTCIKPDLLTHPAGLTVNKEGNLLVADRENHCIWEINPEGRILRQIGRRGSQPGELNLPYGVAVSSSGHIIVTESGNARVSIFSEKGQLLTCFGGRGSEPGRFDQPRHVCVNSKEQIIVADEMNQRIQVFDLYSMFSTDF